MKKWITVLHVLLVWVGFTTLTYAQPSNDACGAATAITVGVGSCNSILYTNVAATSVGDPTTPACWAPSSLSHSVWFSFVATSADIEISTNFAGTLANTQLAVYSGSCGSLTQIGCQENINTAGGLLHTNVILHGLTIGNTYYLLVDGNGTSTGTFGICAQESLPVGPPMPTQDCVGAQTLCGLTNIVVPNGPGGVGASIEEPSCFGAPGERSSNWYSFTAATSGTLAFTITPNAVIDYDFAIYDTTVSCPGTEVSCNWEPDTGALGTTGLGCGGIQCEPTLAVIAGHTYTILVDRYTATSSAGFTMGFAGTTASFASPNPTFTATTACIGTATQFTNTTNGNFTYNWNFGDGFTSNVENPSHTFATPGPHNVTLLLTAVPGGCQNAVTQVVTVNPIPTVNAGTDASVCPGNCVTLSGSTNAVGSSGQSTFSNTADYNIPDGSNAGVFSPITTTGLSPATIGASSIASVCLNIDHTFDGDLDIFLQCPDGTRVELSTDNGGLDMDYINTCFTPTAVTPITSGTAPFTGTFSPEQSFNVLNGCTANGTWQLFVRDDTGLDTGTIRDWTITFNNNLPAFTWTPTAGMTNATTLSPNVCPAATTTYTLTASNGIGCTATDTVTITRGALAPTLTCGFTTQVSVQFDWNAVPGATSYVVSYQVNGGPVQNPGNIGNLLMCTVNGLTPGASVTLTVTPVGGSGTCFTSATLKCITSLCAPPDVPTIITNAPTCTADGRSTISNYNAANVYTFSPTGPTVGGGGLVTGAVVGTAYTVTSTFGGCTSSASTSFTNLIRLATPAIPTITTTAPTCAANGFSTMTNYNAANFYLFSPTGPTVGAGGVITGALIGTAYTVSATNNGCTSLDSSTFTNLIRLTTPSIPTITTTAPTCLADGFSTITNYNAANTYTFSPTGPTVAIGGIIAGAVLGTAYTITATNSGCTSAVSASFTNLIRLSAPAVPTITTTAPTCLADGFSTITNYNAATTYTFSPTGPTAGAGGTITGALLGTAYTITATNGSCTSNASSAFTNVIRLTTPAVPTIATTAPTCAGNGFSTITNYNAANTYTFSPTGPTAGVGGTINGAAFGTVYTITATNGGCTSGGSLAFTNSIRLTTPAVPTILTTAPTCLADGFSTITNYNAANTYTFSPTGPTAGAGGTITGAILGTAYTITATNGSCTSNASSAFTNVIRSTTPAVPTISTTAATCAGDGFSTITNYNATNTYTFSPTGPAAGAGGTITGATFGTTYTITATNGGCTSGGSLAFTNAIRLTTPAVPTISTTTQTCTADGFSTITNYNAANTYTFSPTGPTAGAGGTITGAILGTAYTITATNGSCTSNASLSFTNAIRLTTPAIPTISTTAPTCLADGFTVITNYNPTDAYNFSPSGPVSLTDGTITGATLGTAYTVITNNGSCVSAPSASFTNLAQLVNLATPTLSTTAPTCVADGFTTISNYTPGYTYTFSPTGPTVTAGGLISGAIIGTAYTVVATQGVCTSTTSAAFTNLLRVVTPVVPTISTTAPTCTADGFSVISNYNAANTYTFSPTGPTANAGGIITGATFGTAYNVAATNGSCTSTSSLSFTNIAMLGTPVTPIIATTAPTCFADGFSTITNYNAANTYTFSPTGPNVGVGGIITGATISTSYTITATNGSCTSAASIAFTNSIRLTTPAVPTTATTAPSCAANGFTVITNYNPTNSYTFVPSGPNAGVGGIISGATFGTSYTVTATNGSCTSLSSLAFTNAPMLPTPAVPTITTTAPTCTADGFSVITNYNAVNSYTFSPAGPTANAGGTVTGAVPGTTYIVTATNLGCTSGASASFTNPIRLTTPATPTISTTAPTCTANGFTIISNYSTTNNYTFLPSGPIAGAGGTITGAVLGTAYTITATNGGCTSAVSTSFTNSIRLTTPAIPTITTNAPTCTTDGFATITNYNSANTYIFSPIGPTVGAGGLISGATFGTAYTVTATNGSCTSNTSSSFTNLIRLGVPVVPTIATTPPNCSANGFTTITNYDATAIYTFTPSGPVVGTGGIINNATIGMAYAVTATKGGCTSGASNSFTNLIMLATPATPTLSTTAPTCSVDGFTVITDYNSANTYTFSPTGPVVGAGGIISGAAIATAYTVTATNNGCISGSASFTTLPSLFNITAMSPAPMHYCDPNNDGFGIFNLTSLIPGITGGNPYLVTFHETPTDAAIGGTTIPSATAYENIDVDNQTIYIRVRDNATGCFIVVPLQLIVDPTPEATEPNDYHLCDDNRDGIANFNLTSVIGQVLGTINPVTHTVSFYNSFGNAQSEISPITNLIAYPSAGETIWIRVENNVTGCFDIVTLELIVDPLPLATQPNYPQYSLCDTTLPLSFEEFDLGSKIPGILLGQSGMAVTFHFDQAQATSNTNPLSLLYTNVVPFVQTIWIRIENINTHCFVLSTMDIRVEPLPTPIPPTSVYSICDNNQDGFGSFDLDSLTNAILQGANYTITYHETYDDAQLGDNDLTTPYDNVVPFTQFIYVLAVDNVNGCKNIISIELEVKPQPITPFTVPDLVQCDEDASPQNGSMVFDLTQNNAAVLGIQPSAATDYTVTYHLLQADAINGVPAIIQTTNYVGTHNQTIWVRVEDNATGCFSIGSFELLINAPAVLINPTPLSVCDADANPNNQFTTFDLTVKNNEITGSQTGLTVEYFSSYPVTASSIPIPNPTSYSNAIAAVQTLGVRVTTPQGCRSYTTLDIRVLPIPVPNTNAIRPLTAQCDVNNTGDMLEIFDLTANASNIINGDPSLTLHYYPTQTDALDLTNEIMTPATALVGQNVWIRVENNRVDYLGNRCFVLIEQPLTVNPLPDTIPNTTVQECDDDTDGQTSFDLTATALAFYGAANVTITYYTSAINAQNGTSPITTPTSYLNISNPQIIYIRVVDNVTGCVNYNGQFTITVDPKPTATAPTDFETCDTDGTNDGFFALDLSTYISGVIGAQTGVNVTFHNLQADATNDINPITDLANYQTYTHTIWIRVENTTTGCYQLVAFDNVVEQLAEPIITAPTNAICVEFGTDILLSGLTLDSGITNPNYTFEWFEAAAPTTILGTNAIYNINTVAPGTYSVVATSTSSLGCVSNPAAPFTVIQAGPAQFSTPPYTVSNAFDDNQVITINVVGHGVYEFSLDNGPFQSSNIFENASLGEHSITVRDVEGNTSCGEITLDDIQTINYPHYFTPNGDGYNDTWNVVGLQNQLNAKLYIFDRYGKLLKQISTNGEGWDGTFNGHALPSTDYWFKIEYTEQSQVKEFRAHFALKR